MVKLVYCKVAAADPGHHMAIARVQRQKSGLQAGFVFPQFFHEGAIASCQLERLLLALASGAGSLVLG